jgi:pimeloyl-ACP methyl ester carboxylesterase
VPFVERGGIRVHYEVDGEGPALFLLPGAGCDGSFWRRAGYLDALVDDYRCIAVDPRGFGRSSRPEEPEAMRVEEFERDVVAIADALGLERFALWGQSAGGFVASGVGVTAGSRVTAIVNSGGTPALDEPEWREWSDAQQALAAHARASSGWKEFIEGVAAHEGLPLPAWVGEIDCDIEMGARLVERLLGQRFRPELLQLEQPYLLLVGEHEEDPSYVERARRTLPRAQVVVLPGLGHVGAILAVEPTLSHVRPFLAGVTSAVSAPL